MGNQAVSINILGNVTQVLVIEDNWLDAQRWDFTYLESRNQLKFSKWMKLNKKTSRHKYKVIAIWDWYDRRGSTLNDPTMPNDEIVQAAKAAYIAQISDTMTINLDVTK